MIGIKKVNFLHLCGKKDREILQDLSSARFGDLVRLQYLIFTLGYWSDGTPICQALSTRFPERLFAYLEQPVIDEEQTEQWLKSFYEHAPTEAAKRKIVRKIQQALECPVYEWV